MGGRNFSDGHRKSGKPLFSKAKQKVTVLFTDEGMNKTPTFPRETETDKGNDNAFDAT